MADIYLRRDKIESIFELLGNKENDITYSIGWVLADSQSFLRAFLQKVGANTADLASLTIRLQEFKHESGITDIEIKGQDCHIIIEAKRGWSIPHKKQLSLYAKKMTKNKYRHNLIICMSECSNEYAQLHLRKKIQGIPIRHFSWKDIAYLTKNVENASHSEKRLLHQLRTYLRRIVNMQQQQSNMVYVVSLGSDVPKGCSISWIDIVEKKRRYFHPVGRGWPSNPPNYLGFRYRGKLQRIHHI